VILTSTAANSLAMMVSALARTTDMSVCVLPFMLELSRLFGGFFLSPANLPSYFVWLDALSYVKYGYVGIGAPRGTSRASAGPLETLPAHWPPLDSRTIAHVRAAARSAERAARPAPEMQREGDGGRRRAGDHHLRHPKHVADAGQHDVRRKSGGHGVSGWHEPVAALLRVHHDVGAVHGHAGGGDDQDARPGRGALGTQLGRRAHRIPLRPREPHARARRPLQYTIGECAGVLVAYIVITRLIAYLAVRYIK
jgi:hypothetical protein